MERIHRETGCQPPCKYSEFSVPTNPIGSSGDSKPYEAQGPVLPVLDHPEEGVVGLSSHLLRCRVRGDAGLVPWLLLSSSMGLAGEANKIYYK